MFCSVCGKELQDGQNFCQNCGTSIQNVEKASTQNNIHIKKYKCPKCGSYRMNVRDQLTGSVGTMTQATKNISTGYSTAQYSTVWQCEDCGFRFEDPAGRRKGLKGIQGYFNFLFVCLSAGVMVFSAFVLGAAVGSFGVLLGILLGILFGVFTIRANNSRTKQKLLELDEFEKSILTKQF